MISNLDIVRFFQTKDNTISVLISYKADIIISRDGKHYRVPVRRESDFDIKEYTAENFFDDLNRFFFDCQNIMSKWEIMENLENMYGNAVGQHEINIDQELYKNANRENNWCKFSLDLWKNH